jgi:predicted nucleic acid-binding protein
LKIILDTQVIIDTLIRADEFPDSSKLIQSSIHASEVSLWISATSIVNIESVLSKFVNKTKVQNSLDWLSREFSLVPFRKSTFKKAMAFKTKDNSDSDFETAILAASAEEMGMDFIVSRNRSRFRESKVPAVTPSEFLIKWKDEELTRVVRCLSWTEGPVSSDI